MAEVEKFTSGVMMIEKHYDRLLKNDNNKDIDPDRTSLNYSITMDHDGLTPNEYYKKVVADKYVYGRGTKREDKTVTSCAWVITAPADIVGAKEKEKEFFQGAYDFVANRYGSENILHNAVHYDEGGRPHIHIMFCPVTNLDKERLHYSTQKVAKPIKLESGRYEYSYRFKQDKNGERIPLKNYSRMADYYDEKISAADVLNKFELQHFHQDLQDYLDAHGIEGKILNGATSGGNISVKSLKTFTEATGLTIDDLKESPLSKEALDEKLEGVKLSPSAKVTIQLINQTSLNAQLEKSVQDKDLAIATLKQELKHEKDLSLSNDNQRIFELESELESKKVLLYQTLSENEELRTKLEYKETSLEAQKQELAKAQEKISDLEAQLQSIQETPTPSKEWGNTSDWGRSSGWGNKDTTREATKSW